MDTLPDDMNFGDDFVVLATNDQKSHFYATAEDTAPVKKAIYLTLPLRIVSALQLLGSLSLADPRRTRENPSISFAKPTFPPVTSSIVSLLTTLLPMRWQTRACCST